MLVQVQSWGPKFKGHTLANNFLDFSLLTSLQETLKEKALKVPTEIQRLAIPALTERKSIVGIAETGSGKTLAYVLPILNLIVLTFLCVQKLMRSVVFEFYEFE